MTGAETSRKPSTERQISSAACPNHKAAKCNLPPTKPPEGANVNWWWPVRTAPSVDGLEDLASLGMVARENVEPQVGIGQMVCLMLEGEVGQCKEGCDDPGGLG
jgi:hypothetical protein